VIALLICLHVFENSFIIFLNYHISIIQRGFVVGIPYMFAVYFEQVHPLYYIYTLLPLFQTLFGAFHCAIYLSTYIINHTNVILHTYNTSYIYISYFNPLHLSVSLPFPNPPSIDGPWTTLFSYLCPVIIIIIILGLVSTSEGEHVIFDFWSLACLTQPDELHFYPHSCK
jgi:hypothetical protein